MGSETFSVSLLLHLSHLSQCASHTRRYRFGLNYIVLVPARMTFLPLTFSLHSNFQTPILTASPQIKKGSWNRNPSFFLLQESQLLLPRPRRVSSWYSSAPSRSCRRPSGAQSPSSSSGRRRFFQPTTVFWVVFVAWPLSPSRFCPPLLRLLSRKTHLHSSFLPSSSESRSSTKKKTLDFDGQFTANFFCVFYLCHFQWLFDYWIFECFVF